MEREREREIKKKNKITRDDHLFAKGAQVSMQDYRSTLKAEILPESSAWAADF